LADYRTPVIFDGHNDVLLKLYKAGGIAAAEGFVPEPVARLTRRAPKLAGSLAVSLPFTCPRPPI